MRSRRRPRCGGSSSRDVAEAAFFLCSDRAAAITGVTLPVDAGWLVQAPYAHYLRGNPIRSASVE